MIKRIIARLTGFSQQRENLAQERFVSDNKREAELARERHDMEMEQRRKKYVSEVTAPSEEEIVGPSDSKE